MPSPTTASEWLNALKNPQCAFRNSLTAIYGTAPDLLETRVELMRTVVQDFMNRFGEGPLRLFRSPGRINLRGMHVDTHGGYLNLMTHQREVIAAARNAEDDNTTFASIEAEFPDFSFKLSAYRNHPSFTAPWINFITHPDIAARVTATKGSWENYVKGSLLRAQYHFPEHPMQGIQAMVGSDLPRGAALSSSHSLLVSVLLAGLGWNCLSMDDDAMILAIQDAEWFTGARCGMSDQAAEILGRRDELVNVALFTEDYSLDSIRRFTMPEDYVLLVTNSHTQRSLSGAQQVAYTKNRFAYSMALKILQQELIHSGDDSINVERLDRFSRITPEALGGLTNLYTLLARIPEEMTLDEMRSRYDLPGLDAIYQQYFGTLPEALRPQSAPLRGPLCYGLAESERARHFYDLLSAGNWKRAGQLMSLGHDGDRVMDAEGNPYHYDLSDSALMRLAENKIPIEEVPGQYGASSPVLDALVDTAKQAGALGACLTGAGIAGSMISLCRKEDTDQVARALRNYLISDDYAQRANRPAPLSQEESNDAVLINHATAGACEILMP